MKSLVSGVLVRLGSLWSEDKFSRACSPVSWFKFIDLGEEGGVSCLTYCLISSDPGKVIKCFLIPFSCPPKAWNFISVVPSFLARLESLSTEGTFLRTWSQVSGLTKSLVPSVLARLGSLPTEFTFLRTWSQVSRLTKSLVPSVLARLGSLSIEVTFLRTWSQVSWLMKSLVPRVLARLGSLSTEGIFLKAWFQLPWFNQKVLSPSAQKGLNY